MAFPTSGLTAGYSLGSVIAAFGGLNLTNNNSVAFAGGKVGNCAQFAGASSQYLSHADNDVFEPANMSIQAWIKTATKDKLICDKWTSTVGWRLQVNTNGFPSFGGANGSFVFAQYSVDVCDGAWHHLVGTFDGTNYRLYVDSVLRATTAGAKGTNSALFTIGCGSPINNFFTGDIDEVFIWDRALALADVQALYNGGNGEPFTTSNRRRRLICAGA
jgi:hypothetical protein